MKTPLNIKNLIEKGEEIVSNGRMDLADRGEVPVQIFEDEEGREYHLSLVMIDITGQNKKAI